MGGYNQDKRLETLEAETPERPKVVVLESLSENWKQVAADYRARTPEEEQPELVVVLMKFGWL